MTFQLFPPSIERPASIQRGYDYIRPEAVESFASEFRRLLATISRNGLAPQDASALSDIFDDMAVLSEQLRNANDRVTALLRRSP